MYVFVCMYTYVCICGCMYVGVCMCVYICVYMYACIFGCLYVKKEGRKCFILRLTEHILFTVIWC